MVRINHFGGEVFIGVEVEKLAVDKSLIGVDIGKGLILVLDIRADDGGLRGDIAHLVVGPEVVGLRVAEAVMVILGRGGEVQTGAQSQGIETRRQVCTSGACTDCGNVATGISLTNPLCAPSSGDPYEALAALKRRYLTPSPQPPHVPPGIQ